MTVLAGAVTIGGFMDLVQINNKLEELAKTYSQKARELRQLEYAYNLRFWNLILHSGMGTIAAKEAEANTICHEEGLLEPLQELKADMKALYYEKDCYIAMGSNLRVLEGLKGGE